MSVGLTVALGPLPITTDGKPPSLQVRPSSEHADALRSAVALVPDDAPVAATTKAGSHLSARRYFYSLPLLGRAEWIVLDLRDPWIAIPRRQTMRAQWGRTDRAVLERMRADLDRARKWTKVFGVRDVFVYRLRRVR
jgi:hypothetical protein